VLISAVAAIALSVAGGIYALSMGHDSSPSAPAWSSPAVNSGPDPLKVTMSWPLLRGCDGATAVAMLPGNGDIVSYQNASDQRTEVVKSPGGGSWRQGHLILSLT